MQRLTQLLKNLFAPSSQQSLNTTGDELTLHDVLRICATRIPQPPRPPVVQAGYRLTANCCLEISETSVINLRSHTFAGRLAAYGLQNHDSRLALAKRQAP